MNNKGFTLVELLAVIIILSILTLIVTITVGTTINNSKKNLSETQIKNIENAAEAYYLKEGMNDLDYSKESTKTCVNVSYLTENGYIDDIGMIEQDKDLSLGSVKITYKSNEYTYEYQESVCSEEDFLDDIICEAVEEATTGNIPEGKYEAGDEYICEVKKGTNYRFFILSTEGDNVNLILDRNINSDGTLVTEALTEVNAKNGIYNLMEWVSKADYNDDTNYGEYGNNDKGPITAMNFLYNATKDWTNIPNIQMDYEDEGNTGGYGYGKILTTNNVTKITKKDGSAVTVLIDKEGYTNLKARMPYLSEVSAYDSTNKTNAYLYNYLDGDENIPINDIFGIMGYWISSSEPPKDSASCGGDFICAFHVTFTGSVYGHEVGTEECFGVRPVISIYKSQME